jgi:hypothetical protein
MAPVIASDVCAVSSRKPSNAADVAVATAGFPQAGTKYPDAGGGLYGKAGG